MELTLGVGIALRKKKLGFRGQKSRFERRKMKVQITKEEALTLYQKGFITPVTGFNGKEDVATLLDCWTALQNQGVSWNRVEKVWEGEGYYFFETNENNKNKGDFNIFTFVQAGIDETQVLNPVTARTIYGQGRGVSLNLPTSIAKTKSGVYLGDLMVKKNTIPEGKEKGITNINQEWVLENFEEGINIQLGENSSITIGRDKNHVDKVIVDQGRTISRRHCVLRTENGVLTVRDLGSINGTKVNNRRIKEPTQLNHLDMLTLGGFGLVVKEK